LGLLGGDGGVAVDQTGEDTTESLDTKRKGGNIEQEKVSDLTSKDGTPDSGTNSDGTESKTFQKYTSNGEAFSIHVRSWPYIPAVGLVLSTAITTTDLTFITWNKAYSLLRYTTYVKKEAYMLKDIKFDPGFQRKLTELDKDGFHVKGLHWNEYDDVRPAECKLLSRLRRIGDRHTWTIPLDTEGITPSITPDSVIEVSTFRIYLPTQHLPSGGPLAHYMMDAMCGLSYPVIKHRYITAGFDSNVPGFVHTAYSKKLERLDNHLYDATVFQLTKMEADKRPARPHSPPTLPQLAKIVRGIHLLITARHSSRSKRSVVPRLLLLLLQPHRSYQPPPSAAFQNVGYRKSTAYIFDHPFETYRALTGCN
jgi:hypothetical protein